MFAQTNFGGAYFGGGPLPYSLFGRIAYFVRQAVNRASRY